MKAERGGREGQKFGNYRLVRLLGSGAFADVYLGEHLYLKTPVAIKVLQTNVASKDAREGFLKEAQTIARLIHPNIVRITDFGVEKKIPFLVMDYAPNGTLRQRYPGGTRLPLTTIVSYVRQIANAVQYAHEEKIIHRDIKPENMLVGRHDEALLSDFGIALVAQSSRYHSTQEIVGTVAYMAPEQISGQPLPASDQYSLAVVVYEWLCGTLPFSGPFKELGTQHLFASPPSLQGRVPTISPEVERVVMTALAKDPKQRFASILAFANALEEAARAEELPGRPQGYTPTIDESPVESQLLHPTLIASPGKYGWQPTEKAAPLSMFPPSGGPQSSQLQEISRTPVSATKALPFRNRLRYAFNAGVIAGILSALLHIVTVLLNASTFREARQEILRNTLTVNTAFGVVVVQSLNLFVSLLIYFVVGFVIGKIVTRRSFGFLTGVLAGTILFIATFLVSALPAYPASRMLEGLIGTDMVGNGIVIALVFLCIWSITGGLVSLLGAWIATRKHPDYI